MKTENTQTTRLWIVITMIAISLILITSSAFSQCEPYKYGPYTKQDVYITPIIPLIGTFLAVEYAQNNGASRAQRDRVALAGFFVTSATCGIDFYVKNYVKKDVHKMIKRRKTRRAYGL